MRTDTVEELLLLLTLCRQGRIETRRTRDGPPARQWLVADTIARMRSTWWGLVCGLLEEDRASAWVRNQRTCLWDEECTADHTAQLEKTGRCSDRL